MKNESCFIDVVTALEAKVKQIKHTCLEMCVQAGVGHVTSAFSCAELVVALYYNIMNIDPVQPHWQQRDRFIMSKNHGSVITYPILADLQFIPETELMSFMQNGSRLGGHSKLCVPGVDFAGGSLGIGLGVAAGMAYAAKMDNATWKCYTVVGDGECYEGSIWESAMFAAHNKLSNLVALIDCNGMACTDFTEKMLNQASLGEKFRAFGWKVREINGHQLEEVLDALQEAKLNRSDKPFCIVAHTTKGNGIDFMSNQPLMHGIAPKGDFAQLAFEQLERNV